jgi:hypothetical protein
MQRRFSLASNSQRRPRVVLCTILLVVFASTAFAARSAGEMLAQDNENKEVIARRAAASGVGTASSDEVLPLDHGPRATTTPWLNQQRRLKAQAAASAATKASASGSGAASTFQH